MPSIQPDIALSEQENHAVRAARHQRLRMQRFVIAVVNYGLISAISFYMVSSGDVMLTGWSMALVFGLVCLANAVFFGLFLSGRNKRYRDPSLTRPQLIVGFVFLITMSYFSRTLFAQDVYLISYVFFLFFGAFRFNSRELAHMALPVFVVLATIMIWRHATVGQALVDTAARVVIFGLLFGYATFFVGYIGRLRQHLSERNLELREAMRRIEDLAITDELTGAFNRRYIYQTLENERIRAERTGSSFSICMLDVDHFKTVNDAHGHVVGDAVLREIVRRIRRGIRSIDRLGSPHERNTVGRFGGEEFVLVLPGQTESGAHMCAERVRNTIERQPMETETGHLSITLSAGFAEYRSGETIESLIKRADAALYQAKANGRNRVEPHQENVRPALSL